MNTSRKSIHRNRSSFYYITSNTLFFFIRNTSRELTQTKKLDWSVGVVTSTTKYYKQAHLHCTIAHKTFRENHSYVHRVRNVYIVFSINQVFDKKKNSCNRSATHSSLYALRTILIYFSLDRYQIKTYILI